MLLGSKCLNLRRPLSPRFDPRFKISDDLRGHRLIRGHRRDSIRSTNRFQQQAFIRLTRNNRRSIFASLKQSVRRIDTQFAARLLPAVAAKTGLSKNRTNLLFKEGIRIVIGEGVFRVSNENCETDNCNPKATRHRTHVISAMFHEG